MEDSCRIGRLTAIVVIRPSATELFADRLPLVSEGAAFGWGGVGPGYCQGLGVEEVVVDLDAEFGGQAEEACDLLRLG